MRALGLVWVVQIKHIQTFEVEPLKTIIERFLQELRVEAVA